MNTPDNEAERLFQLGRAHDISIKMNLPDSIPAELRELEADRGAARGYFQQAADLGHTGAMNNLAVYIENGWPATRGERIDHKAAFDWNVEMARRGDPAGFVGMGVYLLKGSAGEQNPNKAEACFVQAAKMGSEGGAFRLAMMDLGLFQPLSLVPASSPKRDRGIALLKELGRRGNGDAYGQLMNYFEFNEVSPLKAEFYGIVASEAGDSLSFVRLADLYRGYEDIGFFSDRTYHDCLVALSRDQIANFQTLCPRPDGPLTRAMAGLPPAPTEPLDIRAYLEEFGTKYPSP